MALVATYEIVCEALPFVAVSARVPDVSLRVDLKPTQDATQPFVLTVPAESAADVEPELDAASFVGEWRQIDTVDAECRYHILPAVGMDEHFAGHLDDVAGLRALARDEILVDDIRVTPRGWIQSARFADRESFDALRTYWQDNAKFRLRRLQRTTDDEPSAGLTDPQEAALRTASEMGYFEVPRRTSLEAVATALDISPSSLSERLRRAQAHLVESAVVAPTEIDP